MQVVNKFYIFVHFRIIFQRIAYVRSASLYFKIKEIDHAILCKQIVA